MVTTYRKTARRSIQASPIKQLRWGVSFVKFYQRQIKIGIFPIGIPQKVCYNE